MENKINNIASVLEKTGMSKSHARQMAENIHSTGDEVHKDFEDRKEDVTMNTGKREMNEYEKQKMNEMRQEALDEKPIEVAVDYETPDKPLNEALAEAEPEVVEETAPEFQEPEPIAEVQETSYDEHEDSEPAYEEPVEAAEEGPIEVPEEVAEVEQEAPAEEDNSDMPESNVDLSETFNFSK